MKTTKQILTLVLVQGLVACAGAPSKPPAVDVPLAAFTTQPFDERLEATGRLAYVAYYANVGLLGDERAAQLISGVRMVVEAKGFRLTKDPAKAHVHVSIMPWVRTQNELKLGPANDYVYAVSVAPDVNAYGRRARRWFQLEVRSGKGFGADWMEFRDQVVRSLATYPFRAPAGDQKMKGDPGCLPRLGYHADERRTPDGRLEHVIGRVIADSPADRAGLATGDVIERIGGQPFEDFVRDDSDRVYDAGLTVPVRLRRGERTVLTLVKPALVCGY